MRLVVTSLIAASLVAYLAYLGATLAVTTLILMVAIPVNAFSTIILIRASIQNPDLPVLRERAAVQNVLLIVVCLIGLLVANGVMHLGIIPPMTNAIIVASIFLLSVPATYWLWLRYQR